MHHEGDMRWRRPRRCLRVELVDIAPCRKGDGIASVREVTEEGESRRVRATGRCEGRGHERVASSFYRVLVALFLAGGVACDGFRIGTGLPRSRGRQVRLAQRAGCSDRAARTRGQRLSPRSSCMISLIFSHLHLGLSGRIGTILPNLPPVRRLGREYGLGNSSSRSQGGPPTLASR